jgi:hypothetical protein
MLKALCALGGGTMEKKKISAKDAVADIRSGMSDADLMGKYVLSNAGLQSLFDKLVTAGYIDLSELLERTAAFLGTVDISESFPPAEAVKAEDGRQHSKSRAATRVNAQETARDIRSGMDDAALMQKYQLSYKGLQSLFKKLIDVGLVQQVDLDRRNIGFEHTVVLNEDMLSLSAAFAVLGSPRPAVAFDKGPLRPTITTDRRPPQLQRREPATSVEEKVKRGALPEEELRTSPKEAEPDYKSFDRPWYGNPSVVILLACFLLAIGGLIFVLISPD